MKIVVDENIPWAREAFGEFGTLLLKPGRVIHRDDLLDADALIVRSITAVNRELLEGTPVRFVGTATIGTDHLDEEYLKARGIPFAVASGSNAASVAEYVIAALLELRGRGWAPLFRQGGRLGVIGVGEIGGRVAAMARALGLQVTEYDPPRAVTEPGYRSSTLEDLRACDAITIHVPLTHESEHATHHLVNAEFIAGLSGEAVIVNTSRGGVVDSDALVAALRGGHIAGAVLDVWAGEPDVPVELVERAAIATPHIAGYAMDAKLRGTQMMAGALTRFIGARSAWDSAHVLPQRADTIAVPRAMSPLDAATLMVNRAYPIMRDDRELRSLLMLPDDERRAGFDRLRKYYPERREFPAFGFSGAGEHAALLLEGLGFSRA
ncbi:MAG TPA: 4-phosphoerythronate dehydrogenase [Candidatus Kapabacteria bacterium]|nr:4-phosphoerythronate dehydrogenase [Candidatus Kapabacteria bacterium]